MSINTFQTISKKLFQEFLPEVSPVDLPGFTTEHPQRIPPEVYLKIYSENFSVSFFARSADFLQKFLRDSQKILQKLLARIPQEPF